eukprot:gnl/MRDRNA2_/MRDRNA2_15676_c0_seq1.p1 gnl/MRDRNA2_/MRDRNA2_15676_c0~~gnl/MRDRNA2_/MRDRNA2_15676_c0_seq1.p1  ORF type:complete len:501 (-),score=110.61 gnl/MRDRNA2_/MRDRNA2_15676_c0_seq1:22-1377(-)
MEQIKALNLPGALLFAGDQKTSKNKIVKLKEAYVPPEFAEKYQWFLKAIGSKPEDTNEAVDMIAQVLHLECVVSAGLVYTTEESSVVALLQHQQTKRGRKTVALKSSADNAKSVEDKDRTVSFQSEESTKTTQAEKNDAVTDDAKTSVAKSRTVSFHADEETKTDALEDSDEEVVPPPKKNFSVLGRASRKFMRELSQGSAQNAEAEKDVPQLNGTVGQTAINSSKTAGYATGTVPVAATPPATAKEDLGGASESSSAPQITSEEKPPPTSAAAAVLFAANDDEAADDSDKSDGDLTEKADTKWQAQVVEKKKSIALKKSSRLRACGFAAQDSESKADQFSEAYGMEHASTYAAKQKELESAPIVKGQAKRTMMCIRLARESQISLGASLMSETNHHLHHGATKVPSMPAPSLQGAGRDSYLSSTAGLGPRPGATPLIKQGPLCTNMQGLK